jgi:hypothetical protein
MANVFWDITPCGSSKDRRFGEHITPYISLPIEGYYIGPKEAVFWAVLAVVTVTNVFLDITPCGSSNNRRSGEHITLIY